MKAMNGRRDGARPAGETPAVRRGTPPSSAAGPASSPPLVPCPREAEIWRAIEARHWPELCDDELRAHAASCADCADLVEVASVLSAEHEETLHAAQVPPSGAVWYRSQLRVRQDAASSVRRVISAVQVTAVVVALVAVFVIVKPFLPDIQWSLPLILALASPLLLTPVALYLALTED